MKIKELIYEAYETENNHVYNIETVNRLITEIIARCQPFLKALSYKAHDKQLYRGIGSIPPPSLLTPTGELRTYPGHNPHRSPSNTPKAVHTEINHIFTRMFQFPFRNGTFVTHNIHIAETYGMVVTVLPIGDFHFLWSPYVDDLFGNWDEFESDELFKSKTTGTPRPTNEVIQNKYLDIIESNQLQYRTTNLLDAVDSGNEIMIYCDRCIVLPTENSTVKDALVQIQQNHGNKI